MSHRWTEDTPVTRRASGDARRVARESTDGAPPPRRSTASPKAADLERAREQAEAIHEAGLILTPEANALRKSGGDRRALQAQPWLLPPMTTPYPGRKQTNDRGQHRLGRRPQYVPEPDDAA
jgi:hypothetical protein